MMWINVYQSWQMLLDQFLAYMIQFCSSVCVFILYYFVHYWSSQRLHAYMVKTAIYNDNIAAKDSTFMYPQLSNVTSA